MNEQLEIDFDAVDKYLEENIDEKVGDNLSRETISEQVNKHKAILNKKPPESFLKHNSFYGNNYIPIEIIERMLAALFQSYSFKMTIPPVVEEGNIIFFMDVVLVNKWTNEIETFTGTSAVPIKPVNGTLRDVHPHIPAAKSFAIMNACKHIGRLFRAENSSVTDIFDSYFEDKKKIEVSPEENRIDRMIASADTLTKLNKLKKVSEQFESTKNNFKAKKEILTIKNNTK